MVVIEKLLKVFLAIINASKENVIKSLDTWIRINIITNALDEREAVIKLNWRVGEENEDLLMRQIIWAQK